MNLGLFVVKYFILNGVDVYSMYVFVSGVRILGLRFYKEFFCKNEVRCEFKWVSEILFLNNSINYDFLMFNCMESKKKSYIFFENKIFSIGNVVYVG